MKSLVYLIATFVIFLLVAPPSILAVDWKTANQITFAWDESITSGIPQDQVSYSVYMVPDTDTAKANPTLVVEKLTALEYTVTMNVEGRFFLGVNAVRTVDGAVVSESPVSWSDDPAVTGSNPFGVQFYKTPNKPSGLGIK